jgi:hypothetical protein
MASVVSLFISPGIGEPMQTRTSVRALAGRGLEGDRYALGQGSYSKLPRPVARHVSLIAREAMEAANEELIRCGLIPFEPEETRRNIVVEGVDVYELLGQEFLVGAVRLRGSVLPAHAISRPQRPTRQGSRRRIIIVEVYGPRCCQTALFPSVTSS